MAKSPLLTAFIIELSHTLDAQMELALAQESEEAQTLQQSSLQSPVEPASATEVEEETSVSSLSSSPSSSSVSSVSADEQGEKKALSGGDDPSAAALATYAKLLGQHRFDEVEEFKSHHYLRSAASSSSSAPISRAFTRRLAAEYSDLSSSLPIHWASSVWFRVHESRMQFAQMIISGPDGTPYENGLFLFDVHFPPTYPNTPPKVNLQTTGKGSVRFNPNLYDCGKVCLSLLGTWSGGVGEGWNAQHSTILQVAVSIQSLIFVEQPYFNEPSFESEMHTASGKAASEEYNRPLLKETLQWAMLEQMRHPPPGFEEVVRAHFALKRDAILAQAERWAQKNAAIKQMIPDLKKELDKQQLD